MADPWSLRTEIEEGLVRFVEVSQDLEGAKLGAHVFRSVETAVGSVVHPPQRCRLAFPGVIIRPDVRDACLLAVFDEVVLVAWQKGGLRKTTQHVVIPLESVREVTVGSGNSAATRDASLLTIRADAETVVALPKDVPELGALVTSMITAAPARSSDPGPSQSPGPMAPAAPRVSPPVPAGTVAPPVESVGSPPGTPARGRRFCSSCGRPLVPGAGFCTSCGHRVGPVSAAGPPVGESPAAPPPMAPPPMAVPPAVALEPAHVTARPALPPRQVPVGDRSRRTPVLVGVAVAVAVAVAAVAWFVVWPTVSGDHDAVAAQPSPIAATSAAPESSTPTAEGPSQPPSDELRFAVADTVDVGTKVQNVVMAPNGERAYVTEQGANRIVVLDTDSLEVITSLRTAARPNSIAVAPDGQHLYVADSGADSVRVFDLADGSHLDIPVGSRAASVAVTPDGDYVFVALSSANVIAKIDLDQQEVVARIPVGSSPRSIRSTPDGRYLLAANSEAGTVSVIDPDAETEIETIDVGQNPRGARISRDGTMAITPNFDDDTLSLIDLGTFEESARIPVGDSPRATEFLPSGDVVLVANYADGTISVVDVASEEVIQTLDVGSTPVSLAMHPSGSKVLVANQETGSVTMLELK